MSTATAPPVNASGRRWTVIALSLVSRFGTLGILLIMVVVLIALKPSDFATFSNLISILLFASVGGIIACGLTIPLVAGDFDLSVGYVASFAGVFVTGLLARGHLPLVLAIIVTLAACGVIGIANGLTVTKARVNSFIATLGIGTIVIGVNTAYSSGIPISFGISNQFLAIGTDKLGSIPLMVVIALVIVVILWVVLNKTLYGQQAQAVGGNAVTAYLTGIRVDGVRIISFVVSAICAGAGGILLAAQLGSGQLTAADGYLLNAFAAAFLGSVVVRDGEFHILGTVVGTLTVAVAFNGLAILGVSSAYDYVANGALLILAVAGATVARRFAGTR